MKKVRLSTKEQFKDLKKKGGISSSHKEMQKTSSGKGLTNASDSEVAIQD
jgi:hypothetical protein